MKKYHNNSNMLENRSTKSILTKNSKISKKNPEDSHSKTKQIYFQDNMMRSQIFSRTSKNKEKENHLEKASVMIEDLMARHRKAKDKLQKLKEDAEKQYEKMYPFTPTKNSTQRYIVSGNVVKRNEVWLREKNKKHLELKEQIINNSLRQCTFSPTFSSKKQSESYLKSRNISRSMTPREIRSPKNFYPSPRNVVTPKGAKKDFTEHEYQLAKKSLISRMMGR